MPNIRALTFFNCPTQVQHIPQTPTLVKESNKSSNISF